MRLIVSICVVILLLDHSYSGTNAGPLDHTEHESESPERTDPVESEDETSEDNTDADVPLSQYERNMNVKWKDIEHNKNFIEFKTIGQQCKRLIVKYRKRIVHVQDMSLTNLKEPKKCKTAQDTRDIVEKALEYWKKHLNAIVNGVRTNLVKIANVFIIYFKLMVARCEIFAPHGAVVFNSLFDNVINETEVLNIKSEQKDDNVRTLNNAIRYLSGKFNPAEVFQEKLEELTVDNGDDFEDNLKEAVKQVTSIGKILVEMVDALEDTTFKGLKIYFHVMLIFQAHKTVFHDDNFKGQREAIGDAPDFNEEIRTGIRLSKNIKAIDMMYLKKKKQSMII
uniref:Uncharacterized protein n=1 Tax=Cacopsylla melanoneura TaxID=428564 RepID=A0A8D8TZC2_9HEMI